MVEKEEWRPVPGFPAYEISNHCRLRHVRLSRMVRPSFGRYMRYTLSRPDGGDGYRITKHAHRLMWRAFRGEIPGNLQVNHIDGNKLNNMLTNLELVTPRGNAEHAVRLGLSPTGDKHHARTKRHVMARGERHGLAKLTKDKVLEILAKRKSGARPAHLAREYRVSAPTISAIGVTTWLHVTRPQ